MPHLVMCKRYWRIGGDELPLPASLSIFWRMVWMLLLAFVFASVNDAGSRCHEGIDAYLGTSLALFLLSIMCEVLIVGAGSEGTMIELEKRNDQLELYLSAHYVLSFIQLCICFWGMALLNRVYDIPCASEVVNQSNADVIIITLVVITQFIDVTLMFFCGWFLSSRKADGSSIRGGSMFEADLEIGSPNDPNPGRLLTEGDDYDNTYESGQQRVWASRCQIFCRVSQAVTCGLFGSVGNLQDIEAVAKVLTNFFHHNGFLDVVPSDAVAGILLVRLQQRAYLQEYNEGHPQELLQALPPRTRMTLRAARRPLDKLNRSHRSHIYDLHRGSQYAFAIYTWMLLLYAKPVTGPCRLCCTGSACMCDGDASSGRGSASATPLAGPSSSPPGGSGRDRDSDYGPVLQDEVHGDNMCHAHQAAVRAVLRDIEGAEAVYCSFANTLTMKPYGVFLDRKDRVVVVAIRGTLSLDDCLTDAICEAAELTSAGVKYGFEGAGRWVHAGFLRGAEAIVDDIVERNLLPPLLGPGAGPAAAAAAAAAGAAAGAGGAAAGAGGAAGGAYPGFGLRIVGHSLGAGVAFLVSLLLRARYPYLVCYGYGPPGSLCDAQLCRESAPWMTSVVLDDDLIARLGVGSLNHLRDQVLDCIVRAKVNKTYVMQTLFRDFPASQFLHSKEEAPPSSFKDAVATFTRMMKQRNATELDRAEGGTDSANLAIPGRIVHLVKPGGNSDLAEGAFYQRGGGDGDGGGREAKRGMGMGMGATLPSPRSASRDCRNCWNCCAPRTAYVPQEVASEAFAELIISGNMALDHFPDRYVAELQTLHDSWGAGGHSGGHDRDIVLNR